MLGLLPASALRPILDSVTNFCLFLSGFSDADIYQTPRYCVIGTGKKITLECSQTMGLDNMYWYQQDPGMELQLIHYSYGVNTTEKGERSSRSTVSRLSKEHFPLTLETANSSQTSSYFCASGDYTARHRPPQTAQKGSHKGQEVPPA